MVREGATGRATLVVGEADTAIALGSGDVAVLGTPRVLALVEQACVAALGDGLAAHQTSVGTWVELEHLRPTPVGATVVASATLTETDGRRLTFRATVDQDGTEVARARHRRTIVARDAFP